MDNIKETLSNTLSTNQLVQTRNLYSNLDYVLVSLKCVAWFTSKVTLPFLNMCELLNASELLEVLPKLALDLANNNYETLNNYHVDYSFPVKEPTSPLAKYILKSFAEQASSDLNRQRGREYGFGEYYENGGKGRATDLSKLDKDVLVKLDVENLDTERDLSHMDKLAKRAAACSNKFFNGKGMKDDMTLYQASITSIDKDTRQIMKILDTQEKEWLASQKELIVKKLQDRREKAKHGENQINVLIAKCKNHGGPFSTVKDLEEAMKRISEEGEVKRVLRTELLLRKHTSSRDFKQNPELYKVNKMEVKDMKFNLALLLSGEDGDGRKDLNEDDIEFPSEEEMLQMITADTEASSPVDQIFPDAIGISEPIIVIWDIKGYRKWYLGFVRKQVQEDMYMVDHLQCVSKRKGCKQYWQWPIRDDIQEVESDQIIPCNIIGTWDYSNLEYGNEDYKSTFVLDNWEIIEGIFVSLYSKK